MGISAWALTSFTTTVPLIKAMILHTDPSIASPLLGHGLQSLTGASTWGEVCGRCLDPTTASRSFTTNTYAEAFFNTTSGATTPLDLTGAGTIGGYVFLASSVTDQMGGRTLPLETTDPGYYFGVLTSYLNLTPRFVFTAVNAVGGASTVLYGDITRVRSWVRLKLQREYVNANTLRLIAKSAPGEDPENWTTRMDMTITSADTALWLSGTQGAMGFKIRRSNGGGASSPRFCLIDGWTGGSYV